MVNSPETSKAWKVQLNEKLKDQTVLSYAVIEEISSGSLTVMPLAGVGLEVITPSVQVASCFWGAQRASQTLSHFSLSFPGTPGTNGLSGFPTTIWRQSQDKDTGLQTSGLPACSLHHAPFRMVPCFMAKRRLVITVLRVWDTCCGLLGEKLHLLLQTHEVDDAWSDYRGKLERGVTHFLGESGDQSGDIYQCPSEICGDIESLEQCVLTGLVSIVL